MTFRWKVAQHLEINWWKNYLKKRDPKGYKAFKTNYWREKIIGRFDIKINPNDKMIDVGCGPMGIFSVLEGKDITAIDPLLNKYEEELDHFKKADFPNVTFITTSLEAYQPTEQFDTVFCINAINHVKDIHQCYDNLIDLIKPGGRLFISIDAHNHQLLKGFYRLFPYFDILHPHQYDLAEYEDFLTQRGCQIQATHVIDEHFVFNYCLIEATKKADL